MTDAAATIKDEKALLRKASLARRDALAPDYRIQAALHVADRLQEIDGHADGRAVSGFLPIRTELDIRPMMARLRAAGATLCLPAILDKQTIVFRAYRLDQPLVSMGFGTFGPGPEAALIDPQIMLVPLAAFDRQGGRIGYGAGYYDRAIAHLHEKGLKPKLIGIAFDCQEVAHVPTEPHDQSLDAILTESGLRLFPATI